MMCNVWRYLTTTHALRLFLVSIFVLNIIDAIATLYWVNTGITNEANPIMAQWLHLGNRPFVVIKLMLVTIGVGFLWRFRDYGMARWMAIPACGLYAITCMGHCIIVYNVFVIGLN